MFANHDRSQLTSLDANPPMTETEMERSRAREGLTFLTRLYVMSYVICYDAM
jgi:hypothetical protein